MFEDLPDGLRDAIAEAVPLLAALHKDGISHLAFSELAKHQPGLRLLGEALMTSVDPYAHKLAAYSLGYLDDVRTDDFDRILRLPKPRGPNSERP